jgi:hypothetical protein
MLSLPKGSRCGLVAADAIQPRAFHRKVHLTHPCNHLCLLTVQDSKMHLARWLASNAGWLARWLAGTAGWLARWLAGTAGWLAPLAG